MAFGNYRDAVFHDSSQETSQEAPRSRSAGQSFSDLAREEELKFKLHELYEKQVKLGQASMGAAEGVSWCVRLRTVISLWD